MSTYECVPSEIVETIICVLDSRGFEACSPHTHLLLQFRVRLRWGFVMTSTLPAHRFEAGVALGHVRAERMAVEFRFAHGLEWLTKLAKPEATFKVVLHATTTGATTPLPRSLVMGRLSLSLTL
jgi:hypothetical protein